MKGKIPEHLLREIKLQGVQRNLTKENDALKTDLSLASEEIERLKGLLKEIRTLKESAINTEDLFPLLKFISVNL